MRSIVLTLFGAFALVACGSSSDDQGTQDANVDSYVDGVGYDTSTDTSLDSSREVSSDEGVDTTPLPDTIAETSPVDTSIDAGRCGGGPACDPGLTCCSDACRNTNNDPDNCGACGHACSGATSMCLGGSCSTPVCAPACDPGTICCEIDGPGPTHFSCVAGTTCPVGCPSCK
jgi:hypothetical protein